MEKKKWSFLFFSCLFRELRNEDCAQKRLKSGENTNVKDRVKLQNITWVKKNRTKKKYPSHWSRFQVDDDDDEDDGVFFGGDSGVLVPSNEDMEAALLARRKEALLQKYVTANV